MHGAVIVMVVAYPIRMLKFMRQIEHVSWRQPSSLHGETVQRH